MLNVRPAPKSVTLTQAKNGLCSQLRTAQTHFSIGDMSNHHEKCNKPDFQHACNYGHECLQPSSREKYSKNDPTVISKCIPPLQTHIECSTHGATIYKGLELVVFRVPPTGVQAPRVGTWSYNLKSENEGKLTTYRHFPWSDVLGSTVRPPGNVCQHHPCLKK